MNNFNNKGQALVEYILIIALVAIIAISAVKVFGGYVKDAITKSSCSVAGLEYVAGKKAGQGKCEDKKLDELFDDDDETPDMDKKN